MKNLSRFIARNNFNVTYESRIWMTIQIWFISMFSILNLIKMTGKRQFKEIDRDTPRSDAVRQRRMNVGTKEMQCYCKIVSEKVLSCRYSTHASQRTESRRVACVYNIRTDVGMLHGEFQHGPLRTIGDRWRHRHSCLYRPNVEMSSTNFVGFRSISWSIDTSRTLRFF